MKKRSICLIFTLILCITAASCHIAPESDTPTPSASPEASAKPDPEPDFGLAAKSSVYLPNGAFPDSTYKSVPESKYFYDNVMPGLVANDGYGRIYPYLGGKTEGDNYSYSDLYGFCDADGRIVCDPVYNRIAIFNIGGNSYYHCLKNGVVEGTPDHIMIASVDGKVVKRFEKRYIHSSFYGDTTRTEEYVSVKQNGKWGILDKNLNTVIDFKYDHPLYLSEGLIVSILPDESGYVYMDIAENIILGPFSEKIYSGSSYQHIEHFLYQHSFIDGKATFERGYIDKSGVYYDKEDHYSNSNKIVLTDNVSYKQTPDGITLTANGNTLELPDAEFITCEFDYDRIRISYDDAWSLIDFNLNIYIDTLPGHSSFSEDSIIFRLRDYSKEGTINKNGNVIVRAYGKTGAMDMNGKIIVPPIYRKVERMNNFWCVSTTDAESKEDYRFGLIDNKLNVILPQAKQDFRTVGDCICAVTNTTSTLIAPDGKILLTVSLMDGIPD